MISQHDNSAEHDSHEHDRPEPDSPEHDRIDLLAGMRLMVGFEGTDFNSELETLIGKYKVGGVVLFACNIRSADQVRRLCSSIQDYAKINNLPPLFIAVDQEGGEVARLKKPDFTEFPGNPHIRDNSSASDFAQTVARELKGVNINMDLAPVLDVIPSDETLPEGFRSIMTNRSFPGRPEEVATLGACVIETFQKNGIMSVAKHFPGIGRTTRDSHLELPVMTSGKSLMYESDLIPFRNAIQSDVAGIMLSHILYPDMDNEWPASLSHEIAGKLLRDELGFSGVVMTDDLDMKAIHYDIRTSIRRVLEAEIDIALICHKGPDIETAFNEIRELISTDESLYKKGVKASVRINRLKSRYLMV